MCDRLAVRPHGSLTCALLLCYADQPLVAVLASALGNHPSTLRASYSDMRSTATPAENARVLSAYLEDLHKHGSSTTDPVLSAVPGVLNAAASMPSAPLMLLPPASARSENTTLSTVPGASVSSAAPPSALVGSAATARLGGEDALNDGMDGVLAEAAAVTGVTAPPSGWNGAVARATGLVEAATRPNKRHRHEWSEMVRVVCACNVCTCAKFSLRRSSRHWFAHGWKPTRPSLEVCGTE